MIRTFAVGCLLALVSASSAWAQAFELQGEHSGRGPYRGRLTLEELGDREVRVEREVVFADGSTLTLRGVGSRRGEKTRVTFLEQAGLSALVQQGLQAPATTRLGRLRIEVDAKRGTCRSELRLDDGSRAKDVGSIPGESVPPEQVLGTAPPVEDVVDAQPDVVTPFALGEARPLCRLDSAEVHESSGVACSRVADGRLWTHNDSGDAPRLFAFDRAGATRAFDVVGAEATDWEDLCSFEADGEGWLVVGDTGDNKSRRSQATLYLVREPRAFDATTLAVARRLEVRYEDGAHDCEGIAVDPASKQLLLVTKVRSGSARPAVYTVPLGALTGPALAGPAVARRLVDLPAPVPQLTTALDVSADGLRLVVLSYGDAYGWTRSAGEGWEVALTRAPTRIALPERGQGEGLCFGRDGRTLYLTSEGQPCPVWELSSR